MQKYLPYAVNEEDGSLSLKTRLAKNAESYCTYLPLLLFIAITSAYFSYRFYDLYHNGVSNGCKHYGLFLSIFSIVWFLSLFTFFYLLSKFFDGRERTLKTSKNDDEILSLVTNNHETLKKFSLGTSYKLLKESDEIEEADEGYLAENTPLAKDGGDKKDAINDQLKSELSDNSGKESSSSGVITPPSVSGSTIAQVSDDVQGEGPEIVNGLSDYSHGNNEQPEQLTETIKTVPVIIPKKGGKFKR